VAVGLALSGKLDQDEHAVFCVMGDGEQWDENIREVAMEALYCQLDNLVGVIDRTCMQMDGWFEDVLKVDPLVERYRSFGWSVIEIDGNDIKQVVPALQKAKGVPALGRPTVIIANTVKGKGVSFMENDDSWNYKAPGYDEMVEALDELGLKSAIAYDALLKQAKECRSDETRPRRSAFRAATRGITRVK
jgi:transketolase